MDPIIYELCVQSYTSYKGMHEFPPRVLVFSKSPKDRVIVGGMNLRKLYPRCKEMCELLCVHGDRRLNDFQGVFQPHTQCSQDRE